MIVQAVICKTMKVMYAIYSRPEFAVPERHTLNSLSPSSTLSEIFLRVSIP